ncbi:MAG: hypothetical protein K2P30_08550 [Lachnospiraceae bacterium]|nr:hypothetical protein [Lachnospiraceae bacterium]
MKVKNPLAVAARKLYRGLRPVLYKNRNQKVIRALVRLNPRDNEEKLYEEYEIRKLTSVLTILAIGIVSAASLHLCSRMEQRLAEGSSLLRNEWGAGDYLITLWADAGEWGREIPFLVKERRFSEDERKAMLHKLQSELPDIIKKENQDLEHVTGDLNLISSVDGYPFRIVWRSGSKRLRRDGKTDRTDIGENGERIVLTAEISYGEESECFDYEIYLMPEILNGQERFFRKLDEALDEMDTDGVSRKQLSLPSRLDGRNIVWKEKGTNYAMLLLLLSLAGCVLTGRGMENDLMKSCRKRDRQLRIDYPDFVSKLRLYLSAGLTVKSAFTRITTDYGEQGERGGIRYLYEEMKTSCYQLENGITEEKVYQDFGRRCGKTQYRRLGFLLSVHLKQGNGHLLAILSQEADGAQEDERNMARKAGEEAGTKLLLPMMLMLLVIMFLVLAPAYMDFGSI